MTISFFEVESAASNLDVPIPGKQIVQDYEGTLFLCVEEVTSPKKAHVYNSTDGGVTWNINAWEQALGNTTTRTQGAKSQLLLDRIDNTLYLLRQDRGPSEKQFHLLRRDPDSESWVSHASIFGTSGSTADDAERATLIMDYNFRTLQGTPAIVTSMYHFFYYRTSGTDRIVYQNSFFTGGVEEVVESAGLTGSYMVASVFHTSIPSLVFLKNEPVIQDQMDFYFRDTDADIFTFGATWFKEAAIVSTSTYTSQVLQDYIITKGGRPTVLYTANGTNVYIAERKGTSFWVVDQVMNASETPTMHTPSVFRGRVAYDTDNNLYVFLQRSSTVLDIWKRDDGTGDWSREAETFTVGGMTDVIYNNLTRQAQTQENPNIVSGGMMGTTREGSSLKFFKSHTAAFTPEDEPPYDCPAEPTRTSVVISGEGTSAGAFPDIDPSLQYIEEERFQTETFNFEVGYVGTVSRHSEGRRRIAVRFRALSETQKDQIKDFLEARTGGDEAFTWTLPDAQTTIKVALIGGSVSFQKIASRNDGAGNDIGVYQLAFDLIELLT